MHVNFKNIALGCSAGLVLPETSAFAMGGMGVILHELLDEQVSKVQSVSIGIVETLGIYYRINTSLTPFIYSLEKIIKDISNVESEKIIRPFFSFVIIFSLAKIGVIVEKICRSIFYTLKDRYTEYRRQIF